MELLLLQCRNDSTSAPTAAARRDHEGQHSYELGLGRCFESAGEGGPGNRERVNNIRQTARE